MSSPRPSAVEELLASWVKRNPASPVRAVVDRAIDLGFAVVAPDDAAKYLRLVLDPGHRAVTLDVDGAGVTGAGAAVQEAAASFSGAVVRSKDVRLPFDSTDPFAVLQAFGRPPATAAFPAQHTAQLPAPVMESGRKRRPVALAVVAAVVLLLVV